MSEICQDCDKELSEEKGELAHGCLDCHGTIPSEKLFWLRKELASERETNATLREQVGSLEAEIETLRSIKSSMSDVIELKSKQVKVLREALEKIFGRSFPAHHDIARIAEQALKW